MPRKNVKVILSLHLIFVMYHAIGVTGLVSRCGGMAAVENRITRSVGQTRDVDERLKRHNTGRSKYTVRCIP